MGGLTICAFEIEPESSNRLADELEDGAEEYAELRKRLEAAVRRVCLSWSPDRRDDLVQTAMMSVLRIQRKEEAKREFSASYLRQVAYTAMIDELRRQRSRKEDPLEIEGIEPKHPQTGPNPEHHFQGREISKGIRGCLDRLVEPRRIAVTLYLLGHRPPEIAGRMSWNEKRARNLVYRGLENLRACLEEKGLEP